jgi:hypothetical protein
MTSTILAVGILIAAPNLKPIQADEPPGLRGEVTDWSAIGNYPKVIGSQKALNDLASLWGIEKGPEMDFRRYVFIVGTTLGPELKLDLVVDGKGNLEFGPRPSIPPVYRIGPMKFEIKAVDRTSVKSAFGGPLPVK